MRTTKVRLLSLAGMLLCACDTGLPSDGGPSCNGGVSFVACRHDSQASVNGAVECGAQIGFEDGTTLGLSTVTTGGNAFTLIQSSSQQALCGTRALALQTTFSARLGLVIGEVALDVPLAVGHGSGTLTVWLYFEGASTRGVQASLLVKPIAASDPLTIMMKIGTWQRLEARFAGVPATFDVPAKMLLRVFYPNGNWSGVVYLDEVSWRAD